MTKSKDSLLEDYKSGMPIKDIAAKYNISKRTVNYRVAKAGYQGRRQTSNTFYKDLTGKLKPQIIREMILKRMTHCSLCGIDNHMVLQFDHIDPKTKSFDIASVNANPYRYSIIRIAKELDKCRCLCSNCHQIRTLTDNNSWRLNLGHHNS